MPLVVLMVSSSVDASGSRKIRSQVDKVGKLLDLSVIKVIVGLYENPTGGICQEPVVKANILLGFTPSPIKFTKTVIEVCHIITIY